MSAKLQPVPGDSRALTEARQALRDAAEALKPVAKQLTAAVATLRRAHSQSSEKVRIFDGKPYTVEKWAADLIEELVVEHPEGGALLEVIERFEKESEWDWHDDLAAEVKEAVAAGVAQPTSPAAS